jgi:organic radical activating enzyme
MFGRNEIVGRKAFTENGLMVTSIFPTLQGEGPFQGRPAVFVRLAKCNLACSFCDTYFDQGEYYSIDDVLRMIEKRVPHRYGVHMRQWCGVVITGGEPSLQPNVVELMARLVEEQYAFVQVETNGILPPVATKGVTVVVSPKCSERDGKPDRYLRPHPGTLANASALKFVMSADELSPYASIPDWAHELHRVSRLPIYVSPMNMYRRLPDKVKRMEEGATDFDTRVANEVISFWEPDLLDMEANKRNHQHAAKYALDHGLFLTLQQHLYAGLP